VTKGRIPQRAGSLGLNGSGAAAAVAPSTEGNNYGKTNVCELLPVDISTACDNLLAGFTWPDASAPALHRLLYKQL